MSRPLQITGSTVHCSATWPLPSKNTNFYGLTVAPEGTVATTEVLIAADGTGALWQIDATTGSTTQAGTLGTDPTTSQPWGLSGDIVFLANAGSPLGFATVRVTSTDPDTLIQVDVSLLKPGTASTMLRSGRHRTDRQQHGQRVFVELTLLDDVRRRRRDDERAGRSADAAIICSFRACFC
jgi:hypothetical protein